MQNTVLDLDNSPEHKANSLYPLIVYSLFPGLSNKETSANSKHAQVMWLCVLRPEFTDSYSGQFPAYRQPPASSLPHLRSWAKLSSLSPCQVLAHAEKGGQSSLPLPGLHLWADAHPTIHCSSLTCCFRDPPPLAVCCLSSSDSRFTSKIKEYW